MRRCREHDASNEGELAAWKKKCDEFETRMLESLKLIRERESQVQLVYINREPCAHK